jgi:glyoxylase-like metal-dependent hydrolase (beta-lactamase superfamily II)
VSVRVVSPWFQIERIDNAITLLTEPYVDPLIRCNIWHVRGRGHDLIVDTGLGIAGLLSSAPDLFDGRRVVAVATHGHYDHIGGMHEFDERLIHRAETDALSAPGPALLRLADVPEAIRGLLEEIGFVPSGEILSAYPDADFDPALFHTIPAPATTVLEEGATVDLDDRSFRVLHLPGHSPGSIGLWDEAGGVLFSGDAIYDGQLLDRLPGASIPDYVLTMERLLQLPANEIHAGHSPSFGRERLRELARGYLDQLDP